MNHLVKKILFSLFLLSGPIFPAKLMSADSPIPNPPVSCEGTRDPEFNSLRPYQASPCSSETPEFATYCGNDLTMKDIVRVVYPYQPAKKCTTSGNTITCDYSINVDKTIAINLSGAELPIMGNTEDVINSQNSTDSLSSADKVNEYVSWYLNGVINRAEYPSLSLSIIDTENLVNYSGPLNKLLPQEIQQQQRAKTVKSVTENSGVRHDQIVGCTYGIPTLFGQIAAIPGPCYEKGLISYLTQQFREVRRLSDWKNHLPPERSEYKDYIDYQRALQNWRGKSCLEVKIPSGVPLLGGKGVLLCLDDLGKPNFYSALYQNIPLSSTEDVKGQIRIDNVSTAVSPSQKGVVIKNVTFSNQTPSTLFFSHMEEVNQLGELLQTTYVPQGADTKGNPTNISSGTSCKNVQVRSNPGDNLFANQLSGNLHYNANFSCEFTIPDETSTANCVTKGNPCDGGATCCGGLFCNNEGQHSYCRESPTPTFECSKDVYISLSTQSKTPQVDDIWSRLVAGPMAVFKRIFPKTNTEGSVGQIMDIAGSTNITYTGTNVEVAQTNTDLKLPHIGGVSEYFLKGIQTALRPKGFGESIMFEINSIINTDESVICDTNCNSDPANVDLTGVREKFISVANGWYGAGIGSPRTDMFDTVIAAAKRVGVDPIFVLSLWIHESGASNYQGGCVVRGHSDPSSPYCQAVQDFGINDLSIETKFDVEGNIITDHFLDQLNAFVYLPGYYYDLCGQKESAKCPMQYFFAMYGPTGQCNPVNSSNAYLASIKSLYSILTTQTFACYPIKLD